MKVDKEEFQQLQMALSDCYDNVDHIHSEITTVIQLALGITTPDEFQ